MFSRQSADVVGDHSFSIHESDLISRGKCESPLWCPVSNLKIINMINCENQNILDIYTVKISVFLQVFNLNLPASNPHFAGLQYQILNVSGKHHC